jgi:hypothetical protein
VATRTALHTGRDLLVVYIDGEIDEVSANLADERHVNGFMHGRRYTGERAAVLATEVILMWEEDEEEG